MSNVINHLDPSRVEAYRRMSSLLEGIREFVQNHHTLTYIEFDYYVVHDMTLFSVEPDFDFAKLQQMIQRIKKSVPAIKRILSKPIIVLKDTDDVLPVENARIINQGTFLHLANHGQYVSNLTEKGVTPRKLLTRIYEDDYSIYENIVFCNYVDDILSLIKKNRRTLNSLLYASNIMSFNLLEKVNHVNFFLALGKLHTGYIRDFSQYFNLAKELLHELSFIGSAIYPRLHKPVYQRNLKRNRRLPLKKTNIFLMQKDYRQVYRTYKSLLNDQNITQDIEASLDLDQMRSDYLMYVQILTIFSVGHFNFEIDPQVKIDLHSLNITFKNKGWTLDIFNNNKKEILLHFSKESTYKMILTIKSNDLKSFNYYKKNYGVDEVVVLNPYDEDYVGSDDVFISIDDIDSFRRIQQIILKGMIYSDTKREVCPFCGGKLHQDPYRGYHQCQDCMIDIKQGICKETKKSYLYTDHSHLKKYAIHKSDFERDEYWFYEKQVESVMHFRNITKINQQGDIICPYCNKVHDHT